MKQKDGTVNNTKMRRLLSAISIEKLIVLNKHSSEWTEAMWIKYLAQKTQHTDAAVA